MARRDAAGRPRSLGPIVSSAHLADSANPALSEFEFGLILAFNAFQRWIVRCMAAAGVAGMTPLEVMVLHSVFHRGRPKRLADLCLVLGIEDTHTVVYALKKLEARRLVKSRRDGKEKMVAVAEAGRVACQRYRGVRNSILVDVMGELGLPQPAMSQVAAMMRAMSGHYDQATRTAATL